MEFGAGRRRSMSVGDLTLLEETRFVPYEDRLISFTEIRKEAQRMCALLETSLMFTSCCHDDTLDNEQIILHNSTSSEDEFGLPPVLELSKHASNLCINTEFSKASEDYMKSYKRRSISLNELDSNPHNMRINTTFENEIATSPLQVKEVQDEKKNRTFEIKKEEKVLKIDKTLKLLQKGKPTEQLKPIRKNTENTALKRVPMKAFGIQKQNKTVISRPQTRPSTSYEQATLSLTDPKATSTPAGKNKTALKPKSKFPPMKEFSCPKKPENLRSKQKRVESLASAVPTGSQNVNPVTTNNSGTGKKERVTLANRQSLRPPRSRSVAAKRNDYPL